MDQQRHQPSPEFQIGVPGHSGNSAFRQRHLIPVYADDWCRVNKALTEMNRWEHKGLCLLQTHLQNLSEAHSVAETFARETFGATLNHMVF